MQIKGTVADIKEAVQITSAFSKRELWLTVPDENPKYDQILSIEFANKSAMALDAISIGEEVTVDFNLRGREHKGRVWNTLSGWKVTPVEKHQRTIKNPDQVVKPNYSPVDDAADDLPF